MKKYTTLFSLAALLIARIAFAAPAFVQMPLTGSGCGEQYGSPMNLGTGNTTVTAGDTLVLLVSGIGTGSTPDRSVATALPTTPSGSGGAAAKPWTSIPPVAGPFDSGVGGVNGGGRSYAFYTKVTTGGTNGIGTTITLNKNNPGTNFMSACMFEVSGVSSVLDQAASVEQFNSDTRIYSPFVHNSVANELLIAMSSCNGILPSSWTPSSPWHIFSNNGVGGSPAAYLITSSGITTQAIMQQSPAGTCAVAIFGIR
jgi:hypothetical protein